MFLRFIISICACLLLTSCALLKPAPAYNPTLYTLNPIPYSSNTETRTNNTILVLPIIADPSINDKQMAYTLKNHEIAYFAKNNWAAPPAQMILPPLAAALRDSNHFTAVAVVPFAGTTTYGLFTQILELRQDFTVNPSIVKITIACQIGLSSNGRIIASRQFHVEIPTAENTPYGGVMAANEGLAQILRELTTFVIQNT
ncbi:MAG: ABC-type transport auxiliary lipoprotein family protein [Gammaproteobacteria bacterium]